MSGGLISCPWMNMFPALIAIVYRPPCTTYPASSWNVWCCTPRHLIRDYRHRQVDLHRQRLLGLHFFSRPTANQSVCSARRSLWLLSEWLTTIEQLVEDFDQTLLKRVLCNKSHVLHLHRLLPDERPFSAAVCQLIFNKAFWWWQTLKHCKLTAKSHCIIIFPYFRHVQWRIQPGAGGPCPPLAAWKFFSPVY